MAHVAVLGAGFGGLAAANELRRLLREEDTVTVVDRRDAFSMGLSKLWDLVGQRPLAEGTRPLSRLRDRGIEHVRAEVRAIDPERRKVTTSEGAIRADFLLITLGAAFDPDQVEALQPPAHNLYDATALPEARRSLQTLTGRLAIAILGVPYKCPPAPYEAAFLLDHMLRAEGRRGAVELSVSTPQPIVLPVAGPEASRRVARALEERGVAVRTERQVSRVDPEARALQMADGSTERFDVLLAVPRHVAPPVLARSGLLGPSGWIEPDRATLRTSFRGVYAVGDCTMLPVGQAQLPKAGVFAEAEGRVAARNIAAEITGGEGAEFDGRGYCFVEFGGGTAARVDGDFFAPGGPDVRLSLPDEASFRAKQDFERERLDAWL